MAEIINMPRKQMIGALRRDPSLYVQTVFPFVTRSTSEIWADMFQCKMIDDGDPKRAELIEELNQ